MQRTIKEKGEAPSKDGICRWRQDRGAELALDNRAKGGHAADQVQAVKQHNGEILARPGMKF